MPAAFSADHDDHDGGAARRLPLAMGTGYGSERRRPLGVAIVGGLIVSHILTLYTTPIVYLYLDRLRLWEPGTDAPQDQNPVRFAERVIMRAKNKNPPRVIPCHLDSLTRFESFRAGCFFFS